MEEVIQAIENHGLGFASFIVLIYFIFKYESKQSEVLDKIGTTLTQVQITLAQTERSLVTLTERLTRVEEKLKKESEVK